MAINHRKCAKAIFDCLGGKENIVSVTHCATRLRLVVAEYDKVNMEHLEKVDGIKGIFRNNGQIQLIIGTGSVEKVYEEFLKINQHTLANKKTILEKMMQLLGNIFIPIVPAIMVAGLMMGCLDVLQTVSTTFAGSDWCDILSMFANTAFLFLPILIAISVAKVFGGNIYLAAIIGIIMVHPSLINAWDVGNMAYTEIPTWNIWFLHIRQIGYQGHVIPVVLVVWLMSKLEKQLHKRVPEVVDLFVTPLCTVVIGGFLALGIIGPIFSSAENSIIHLTEYLIAGGNKLGSMIMGTIYPVAVVTGVHHMYNVVETGMLAKGLNTWMPIVSAANVAQAAACLAVGMKAKNGKTKAVAIPSAISAALGITEPAIFGVNLRFIKPFLCSMIGGGIGAFVAAALHVGATSYGVSGILGFLITWGFTFRYALTILVAFASSFVLTWVVWNENPQESDALSVENILDVVQPEAAAERKKEKVIYAPVKGTIIRRENFSDPIFASGVLGEGVGIEPETGVIVAPLDGMVTSVTDSLHAIGISGPEGMRVLIQVGVDTVNMKGEGFQLFVAEGEQVTAGQKLLKFDMNKIHEAGYSTVTAVLVTNSEEYESCTVEKTGHTEVMEKLITVQ